ncbi:hypothetical protein FGO68_gene11115 [Halteria grandinella]|uniref:Uncharacterized protein n=1 Tax=Halteria grandinella TaxID=5974 RepID=A0A8J8SU31_HALGN|nr:hypothetical protein FGO68_gene11115 [Halteria grandinella]
MNLIYMDLLQTDLWIGNIIDLDSEDDEALCPQFKLAGYNSMKTVSNLGSTFVFLFILAAYIVILFLLRGINILLPFRKQAFYITIAIQAEGVLGYVFKEVVLEWHTQIHDLAVPNYLDLFAHQHQARSQQLPSLRRGIQGPYFKFCRRPQRLPGPCIPHSLFGAANNNDLDHLQELSQFEKRGFLAKLWHAYSWTQDK